MTGTAQGFRQTWLWRHAFQAERADSTTEEQRFFETQVLSIRERAAQLATRIAVDMPGLTVHDISHLDALWDTASLLAEGAFSVNPAEAFVFGVSVLLHDAGMSLASYPGGLREIRETLAWKDAVSQFALASKESGDGEFDVEHPPDDVARSILPYVLRRLHAERAEKLAEQEWEAADGSRACLIEDTELRSFYGPTIGRIAHSHWWSAQKLDLEFRGEIGALASRTRNRVDLIKLACLLRLADALHLDSRRAPRFLRAITKPGGGSAPHWSFQERLARPHVDDDSAVFTTGQPFGPSDMEAWWLAYDVLRAVDRELRDVDLLLRDRGLKPMRVRRVKGIESPETLARLLHTRGWRPVDAHLRASNVAGIVKTFGGAKLYGNDPKVALRELIQNAADAIQARRRYENRDAQWGLITVGLRAEDGAHWLFVEDNGIGMSELVLTGPLLDFGTSFWRSPLALDEFPGLVSSGMEASGRYGIGFFSVFMLGSVVRVYSRRFDKGQGAGRLLEFRNGAHSRPSLSNACRSLVPIDGGTRVEVRLDHDPFEKGGLLQALNYQESDVSWKDGAKLLPPRRPPRSPRFGANTGEKPSLAGLVGALAPNLDVAISVRENAELRDVTSPGDWLEIPGAALLQRLDPTVVIPKGIAARANRAILPVQDGPGGQLFGRAFISPEHWLFDDWRWVTIAGLRAAPVRNVRGILTGEAVTVARNAARPLASVPALRNWASRQAELIAMAEEDDEYQARAAEVVLTCGGDISCLKFVRWGESWLNRDRFEELLRSETEFAVTFDGDFSYDGEVDDFPSREFKNFEVSPDVAVVLKYDGNIVAFGEDGWPGCITGRRGSNVAAYVKERIRSTWGDYVEEDDDERVVGTVGPTEVYRPVRVFRPKNSR